MHELDLENSGGDKPADSALCGVAQLSLRHFRNYLSESVSLSQGFNVVSGPNAQGKTNLLEALYLLGTARLLRGVRDREAIAIGETSASVKGSLASQPTEIEIRIEESVRKSAYLNGLKLPRASDVLGRLPCVSVSSFDLALAQGEPSGRRLFLDLELSQTYPSYLRALSLYKKALEHRNALLKAARETMVDSAQFETWETHMAQGGAEIRRMRGEFLEELDPLGRAIHGTLGGGEALGLRFAPKDAHDTAEGLFRAFVQGRVEDIMRGTTTMGPHRDDLQIEVDDRDARLFGSQGQQRTAVISLKLATLLLARQQGRVPLLLLDDMLSDLDERRRQNLTQWVLDHAGQAVLTCTEPESAGASLLARSKVFRVTSGRISEA
ncbi:MAG: DNA replication/repair protein RecF [Armatimonadetes bacterium]|nr:DNA replication/repair protein RecF [Armatimonadota bacterium]